MSATFETLRGLIWTALDREADDLTLDTNLYAEAGLDSMGAVALVVEIEREYGVRLLEEEIPELQTPRQLLDAIARLGGVTATGTDQPS